MNNHYQGDIELNPQENYFIGKIHLTYYVKEDNTTLIQLYLYKNFQIQSINSSQMAYYEYSDEVKNWCRFVLESKQLTIYLDRPYKLDEIIQLELIYQGKIEISKVQINRLNNEYVELGLYSPYFPLTKDLEIASYDFNIKLPLNFHLVNGKFNGTTWKIIEDKTNTDCTLIALNHFKQISAPGLNIYYVKDAYHNAATQLSDYSKWLLNYYQNLFTKKMSSSDLSIVILSRLDGGGYCRPSLIVLPELLETSKNHLAFLGHELAHLWWNKAFTNSWEDWLNESFAQYSSLMVIREYFGEEVFQTLIDKYIMEIKDTPPIYRIERSDEMAYNVLYYKGAYILYQLEKEIGKTRFISFLKQVHINEIKTTDALLNLLAQMESKTVSNHLENALKR